jgi:hypothetical protein
MNLSFLLFSIPIVMKKVPIGICLSLIFLQFSSFLYHNCDTNDRDAMELALLFDQLNIINTSCMISLQSAIVSCQFCFLFLLEKILWNCSFVCHFVYLFSFIKMATMPLFLILILNSSIYYYVQGREFTNTERYIWHMCQSLYITVALGKLYEHRKYIRHLCKKITVQSCK